MSLAAGTRLGPFEILGSLGVGGMGEVYRARDTKLRREVAIKVLPEGFALDSDRVARFQREAELLAALNHPNIAAIYGLEESAGASAIVMELVEGETLAEKLTGVARVLSDPSRQPGPKGPGLQIDEAIPIARQIVDALEAAHDRGVVHRDLKPANIKITPDGKVKVLDFGLAKAVDGSASLSGERGRPGGLSMSPTLSVHATYAGTILGTAAYMSPEQARGKPVDRRTDIWAFGCVLFEMLSGKQAFEGGETVSDAIAAILRAEIDWTALPKGTPPHVQSILRRCLQKDPQKRLPHIGVVRLELDEPPPATAAVTGAQLIIAPKKPLWKRALPVAATAVVVGALAGTAAWILKPVAPATVTRFSIAALAEGQSFTGNGNQMLAISPDGRRVAYAANAQLYLRSMSDFDAKPVPGASGSVINPVFSPDGGSLVFWTGQERALKKLAAAGGAAVTLCPADQPFGISWNAEAIVFGQGSKGILRVSANGGKPETLVSVKEGEQAYGPQILPDGQTMLFTLATGGGADRWDAARVVVQSLKSAERKTLIEGGSDARFLPTGHIVYALHGVLFAVPFDVKRLQVTGGPVPVVEGVKRSATGATGAAQFSVSNTGSMVYLPGPASTGGRQQDLALFDRKGGVEPLKLPLGPYEYPRVSPDGKRIAFGSDDGKEAIVWIYDLAGTTAMRRLTIGGRNRFPIWSADGLRVVFQSDREGDQGIFWQLADGTGTAERLTKPEPGTSHKPDSWLPRGDRFLFSVSKGPEFSLWTFSVQEKKAMPFGDVRSRQPINAAFSPDGQWVAYTSTETGNATVYVQPFPATGTKYQISKATGNNHHHAVWSPDGKEVIYIPGPGPALAVGVTTRPSFTFSNAVPIPKQFYEGGPGSPRTFDIMRDGQRIIGVIDAAGLSGEGANAPPIQVILNWTEELKQKVPNR
jgi:serine/threonine-protein kinase